MYNIREAREEDREQSIQLLVKTFGDMGILEDSWINSWKEYMNKPENNDWNFVATLDEKIVGNLAFFGNKNNVIRGNSIPFAGVWAVATAEDHRRKGIMKSIYNVAFKDMKEKGLVLSILEPSPYPGAQIAYEKLGYALAERYTIFEFPPDALRTVKGRSTITAREMNDTKDHVVIDNLAKEMAQFGSRVFTFPWMHIGSIEKGNFFLFEENSKPVGCAWLVFNNGDDGKILNIYSNYLTSVSVLPSVVELVKKMSSDCSTIKWVTDPQFPIPQYIQNIQKLTTRVSGKMMMRIVDFEKFCSSIKVSDQCSENLSVKLVDGECPWNEGVFSLSANNGKLIVEKVDDEEKPDITLEPYALSQVIGGTTPSWILRELGKIDCSEDVASILDTLFPVENFISYFRF
ncbi:MAG: GNAT family N-acetyltransferase [Candidatus Thorarchaeota archaeon]